MWAWRKVSLRFPRSIDARTHLVLIRVVEPMQFSPVRRAACILAGFASNIPFQAAGCRVVSNGIRLLSSKGEGSADAGVNINRHLASIGLCSRRDADSLVKRGLVLVNGRPAQVGEIVSASSDKVTLLNQVCTPRSPSPGKNPHSIDCISMLVTSLGIFLIERPRTRRLNHAIGCRPRKKYRGKYRLFFTSRGCGCHKTATLPQKTCESLHPSIPSF
jgi:hypothetical protein